MPYAMLAGAVPARKMGIYMGVFNMSIVLPQIVAALGGINALNEIFFSGEVIGTMKLAAFSCVFAAAALFAVDSAAG